VLRRVVTLGADVVVLTLASPFFALWFAQRFIRNRLRARK
jgi:hypothetical protein